MTKNTKKKISIVKPEMVKPEPAQPGTVRIEAARPEPVKAAPLAKAQASLPTQTVTTRPALATNAISLELIKPGAKTVCVAGTFNGWKPEQAPLAAAGNGRWVGNLSVKPGRYEYLFVVDGQWLPDPNAKESVQNPFGGRNSVLTVSA